MSDPKYIWQNQQNDGPTTSVAELRERLRRLHRRIRIQTAITIGAGLLALDVFVRNFWRSDSRSDRIGWGLVMAATTGLLLPMIYDNYKMMVQGNLSFNAGLTTCVTFYRTVLERQRAFGLGTRRWLYGGCTMLLLVGLVVILIRPIQGYYQILQQPGPPNIWAWIPFLALLVLWGVAYIVFGRRRRSWLLHEFQQLEVLEKENR